MYRKERSSIGDVCASCTLVSDKRVALCIRSVEIICPQSAHSRGKPFLWIWRAGCFRVSASHVIFTSSVGRHFSASFTSVQVDFVIQEIYISVASVFCTILFVVLINGAEPHLYHTHVEVLDFLWFYWRSVSHFGFPADYTLATCFDSDMHDLSVTLSMDMINCESFCWIPYHNYFPAVTM